jgi:hypothetical protein
VEKALYLFALAREGLLPEFRTTGLDGEVPVVTRDFANVTAVICEVSLEEFSGPSAEANLKDLEWVGRRVVRHGEIVQEVMHYSPVLPARFGTLFSSGESLDRVVQRNLTEINVFFDFVTGAEEWAVKVMFARAEARERLMSERLSTQSEVLASMSQGLRYVKERQLSAAVEKDVGNWMKGSLTAVATELTECAVDWRKRDVLIGAPADAEAEKVANWAFLVDRKDAEDFIRRISRANTEYEASGLFFDVSGPWPPYSFTPQLAMENE